MNKKTERPEAWCSARRFTTATADFRPGVSAHNREIRKWFDIYVEDSAVNDRLATLLKKEVA